MLDPKQAQQFQPRPGPEPHRLGFGNHILDALPAAEIDRVGPLLRRVFLARDQAVERPGHPVEHVHFPIDVFAWAWASTTDTERPTSVLTVGRRGVMELGRALGMHRSDVTVSVISPGAAWRLNADALDSLSASMDSPLRRLIQRFANVSVLNAACRLACNSEHNIDQRLARWLLWVADETARVEFSITHQQIAEIAAIRRPSVSLALSQFQREGLVRSQHGRLRIAEREQLEQRVCQCYWMIKRNAESIAQM